jgi:hypothetical protein
MLNAVLDDRKSGRIFIMTMRGWHVMAIPLMVAHFAGPSKHRYEKQFNALPIYELDFEFNLHG